MTLCDQLERVRSGEEGSLREVMADYGPLVYGVALRITGSEADAEDILQDVFIGIPEALRKFDGRNFYGWLAVLVARRALMCLRAERRRHKAESNVPWITSQRSHEDEVLSRQTLEMAISELEVELRTVYVLKEVEGLTHAEIANALGISQELSRVRLFRAKQLLKRRLAS